MCRYCLSDDISIDSIENTLICLCKCKGTLKYTHSVCFRHWINSKKQENDKFSKITQSCISYDFKSLICEVCREPIPHSVLINGQEAEILSIERPKKPMPYLLLQRIEANGEIKGIYIISGRTIDGKDNLCVIVYIIIFMI